MKVDILLIKNACTPLAKDIFNHSEIYKKILDSGTTALIFLNEEMEDIMKIVKSFGDYDLLIKVVTEIIEKGQRSKEVDLLLSYELH